MHKPPPDALNLFGESPPEPGADFPLAARIRPRSLEEFVGQEHLVGLGKPLRHAIEQDGLRSAIFYGPAGCGKSTLAMIIAAHTKARFESFSAVTSGVADVRRVVAEATSRRRETGQRTILFVDEIHRFNKAQQDAFLPHVENGTIVLLGATTENPFFGINSPLISRSRVFTFEPLGPEHIRTIVERTLADQERGLGSQRVVLSAQAMEHLVGAVEGDARAALNTLELVAAMAAPSPEGERGVDLPLLEAAMQQRAVRYDRAGDQHYDVISAFIKSMRGSDPDAALHYLARMIKAGEDPRFIARRLVIHAAEDVGMADPMALLVATAAAHAVEYVGLPEARIPLAEATIYIATAPKSNSSVTAIDRATADLEQVGAPPVPTHLRDASYPGAARLGHGEGYRYPHSYPGHWVDQVYLPQGIPSQPYYEPSESGLERTIAARLQSLRARRDGPGRAGPRHG